MVGELSAEAPEVCNHLVGPQKSESAKITILPLMVWYFQAKPRNHITPPYGFIRISADS